MQIVDNTTLSECEIISVCLYMANPGGVIQINNNAPGCNNQAEVEEACEIHCFYEGITFSTQEQIDNFQTDYPACSQIEGDVKIGGNDITNLNGLINLTYIGGDLSIGYYAAGGINPSLNNISGLINLTAIGGGLSIAANPELFDLYGLDSLSSINGDLEIRLNESLANITALSNLNPGSIDDLIIYDNNSLSDCHIESICEYLAGSNGTIEIHDNAPGCNSQGQVEGICIFLAMGDVNAPENYSIYPNPVVDILTFSSADITTIEIYNMIGALIARRNTNKIDMSDLHSGIYFVIGFDKNNTALYKGKIIKK
jgi:hypothetical protein